MTFEELRKYVEQLLDQSQTAYFYPKEIDRALNDAQTERVNVLYSDVEVVQKRRDGLRQLTKKAIIAGTSTIPLQSLPSEYMFALSVIGDWDFVCNGKTTRRSVAIKPVRHDVLGVIYNDPFNTPTNQFPVYVDYTNDLGEQVMEIKSDTVPISVEITYLKRPAKIDSENTPNGVCELPEEEQYNIIRRAVRILTGQTGDMQGYNKQLSEVQLQE